MGTTGSPAAAGGDTGAMSDRTCRLDIDTHARERNGVGMMIHSSSAFEDAQEIPQRHGKKIDNVSPQLSWKGAPRETKSFALSVGGQASCRRELVHWLVVDVDAVVTSLKEGASSSAIPAGSREVKP
jgi:phosphatidylethanolamine-binding protein (PEBP) family uncharacterized protein